MYCIFPFEVDFYKKYNYTVDYVGNPLMDQIYNFKASENYIQNFTKPVIAILPGSRKGEIRKMLPIFYEFAQKHPNYDCIIAGAPSIPESFYREIVGEKTKIVFNQTYDLLNVAHCALVTSGTATLETALFKVPQIVCYKISALTYTIIKFLIQIKYISLVNLILDKEIDNLKNSNYLLAGEIELQMSYDFHIQNEVASRWEALKINEKNQILRKMTTSQLKLSKKFKQEKIKYVKPAASSRNDRSKNG